MSGGHVQSNLFVIVLFALVSIPVLGFSLYIAIGWCVMRYAIRLLRECFKIVEYKDQNGTYAGWLMRSDAAPWLRRRFSRVSWHALDLLSPAPVWFCKKSRGNLQAYRSGVETSRPQNSVPK